jgi:putative membrane protein
MRILAILSTALVALEHVGFMILEMFYWTAPIGLKTFGMTPEGAATSATLAANQGLYNGFLAAGLIWALIGGKLDVQVFFLCCVVVAGIFGAATAKPTSLFVQAGPAALALLLSSLAARKGQWLSL